MTLLSETSERYLLKQMVYARWWWQRYAAYRDLRTIWGYGEYDWHVYWPSLDVAAGGLMWSSQKGRLQAALTCILKRNLDPNVVADWR